MKIPETSANVGAYYGNEENGQWQPNGVIIDSGVGGGVVGSGDAGVHRPPVYPVHIPRGHIPGYVMAGAYYPPAYPAAPPAPQDDFADYMWMENEEEFDKQVMQQLEEEALMEQCIEAMLEDEQREQRQRPVANGHDHPTTSDGSATGSLSLEEAVSRSTLNPLAAEFVPNRARPAAPPEEKPPQQEPEVKTETKAEVESPKEVPEVQKDVVDSKEATEQSKKEESIPAPTEPPEVSAADVLPIDCDKDRRPSKDSKKDLKTKSDVKKPAKVEPKPKAKPVTVKSDSKVTAKKKETAPVKVVKSEVRVEEQETPAVEVVKQSTPPVVEETTQPGIKPINYAAAAKANKPKKPTTPLVAEKTPPPATKPEKTPPPATRPEKTDKKPPTKDIKVKTEKTTPKSDKPQSVQRKNSVK